MQHPVYEKTTTFEPQAYPPERFTEILQEYSGYRSKEQIAAWIEHWANQNHKTEVYRALVEADERGVDIRCYDQLFQLERLLHGRNSAYRWLIKAQIEALEWYWRMSQQSEVEQRWQWVKQYYPERWQDFLRQTLIQAPSWTIAAFSHSDFRRVIEYCLYMNHHDLAWQLLDQMVNQSLELVSMLPLSRPGWVDA